MKKLVLIGVLLMSLWLAACGGGVEAGEVEDVFASGLTRAEYLEDLDYFYDLLRNNFPMFAPIYRTYGVDLSAAIAGLWSVMASEPVTSDRAQSPIFLSIYCTKVFLRQFALLDTW